MIILAIILVLAVHVYLAARVPGAALITSLISAAELIAFSGFLDSGPVTSASCLLIFPATCLAIVLTRGAPDADNFAQSFAKWALFVLGCIAAAALALPLLPAGPFGVFGVLFMVLFVATIIRYFVKSRDAIAMHVVSTIGACMRQNLPLATALESAAAGGTDKRARILAGIAQYLAMGQPLSEAVRLGYPRCPGQVTALITAAERTNQLPAAIQAMEVDMLRKARDDAKLKPVRPWYPVLILFFTLALISYLGVFIVPKFADLFESFGGSLPPITLTLMEYHGEFGGPILGLLFLLGLIGIPVWIYVKFRPRRPENPRLLSVVGDFIKWRVPGLRWFERNYSLLRAVEMLRLALDAGATIDQAIADTLVLDTNGQFRKRLAAWLDKVEQGGDPAGAASHSGLPDALAWAFDNKLNSADTPVLLETVENSCRANYNFRANLVKLIFWPWTTVLVGAMVGVVVVGVFLPIVAIIRLNMGTVLP